MREYIAMGPICYLRMLAMAFGLVAGLWLPASLIAIVGGALNAPGIFNDIAIFADELLARFVPF
jgi:hypothetical protein